MKYSNKYLEFRRNLATGWNTWNTKNLLSHVLLPEGLSINISIKRDAEIKKFNKKEYLKELYCQVYKRGKWDAEVRLGNRTHDGTFTDLELKWRNIRLRVQSTTIEDDFLLLVTPIEVNSENSLIIIEAEMLWNKKGEIVVNENEIIAKIDEKQIKISGTGNTIGYQLPFQTQYLAFNLKDKLGIYTGAKRNLDEMINLINNQRLKRQKISEKYRSLKNVYDALQGVLAWNTIYDHENGRVITPVSRYWAGNLWGGHVLFPWDTFFAAYMFALDKKELSYANAIEMVKEITEDGFVPNVNASVGKSHDRSQPPVGSHVILKIYKHYKEKWFLEEVYDDLLTWNRWWPRNRSNQDYLSWGSNPAGDLPGKFWEEKYNTKEAALYESGLDNSPMYDDVVFNEEKHVIELADVGLISLYIMDCEALAEIAIILNKSMDAKELKNRSDKYKAKLKSLWDEEFGLYLNLHTDSLKKSYRLSPTLFYPLIVNVPTQEQTERMIKEHFFNENEFFGEFIIPSIARNDIAFNDQDYWRGRIWAPFNFLVYLGIKNYDLEDAKVELLEKSKNLLLKEYVEEGHVHENYNALDGDGDDIRTSDCFYTWGALLGFMSLLEKGYLN